MRHFGTDGKVLYTGGKGIIQWDVETGEQERVYKDASVDPWNYDALWKAEDGGITAVSYDGELTFVQRLMPGLDVAEKKVTLLNISIGGYIKKCADEYSRRHPGTRIEIQELDISEGFDSAFQRFCMELVSGEAPDVFVLQRRHLAILQEKGMLAELTDYLPEETLEQVFPSVLEAGRMDGGLYGIGTQCYVQTLAVSEELWQEETWDYPDIIAIMEADEASGGRLKNVAGDYWPWSSRVLLDCMAVRSIDAGQSSLIDEETGKCYFDTEEFVRLLEFCKKYGSESGRDSEEGESLFYFISGNLMVFSQKMAELGEGYRCVGHPGNGSYGGLMDCYSLIGVNKDTENEEVIKDFLQYLLSEKKQAEAGLSSVRRDVLTSGVRESHVYNDGNPAYVYPNRGFTALDGKPGGGSYLAEYLEILDKAVPMSDDRVKIIDSIIKEEAQAYFQGDKTAEEAARIIQNRVQLYLDER